jgi:hypothetical protein
MGLWTYTKDIFLILKLKKIFFVSFNIQDYEFISKTYSWY